MKAAFGPPFLRQIPESLPIDAQILLALSLVVWYQIAKQGGVMPDEKMKQTTFRLSEADHQCLKILAAKERKTIQELVLEALDKVFPHWRKPQ